MPIELLTVQLRKNYPEFELKAEFSLYGGELLALVGPSGCGKTTLLRLIAGLEQPDQGVIRLHGGDITALPPEKRPIGMVFQDYALFPHLTVAENIEYGLKIRKLSVSERRRKVAAWIELLELTGYERRNVNLLSGGERQRVALARALAAEPAVLLMDEPFAALDASLRQRLREEFRRLQRRLGLTVILVTHHQEEALESADRVAVMNNGIIHQIGPARDVYEVPATSFVAKFLGDANLLSCRIERSGLEGVVTFSNGEVVHFENQALKLPSGLYNLMIRPEDMRTDIATAWGITRKIEIIHYRGHSCIIQTEGDPESLTALISKNRGDLSEGATIRLSWDWNRVRFFVE